MAAEGVTGEQVVERLRPLLELPVELVLPVHGAPTDRAALERGTVLTADVQPVAWPRLLSLIQGVVGREGQELGEVLGEDEVVEDGYSIGPGEVGERGLKLGELLVADGRVAPDCHR